MQASSNMFFSAFWSISPAILLKFHCGGCWFRSSSRICSTWMSEMVYRMKNRWKGDSNIILKSCLVNLELFLVCIEAVSDLQRKAMRLRKSESATLSRRKVIGTEFTRRSRFTKHNFSMPRGAETSTEQKIFNHLGVSGDTIFTREFFSTDRGDFRSGIPP